VTSRTDHHEKVFFDEKYEKIVQLFLYKWMHGDISRVDVEMGIISFRNIIEPFLMLENNHIRFDELENNFKILMEEIFNSDLSFVQTNNLDTCKRCIYKNICQRK